jgi:predicted RNA-binding Zn ribbon-like protein
VRPRLTIGDGGAPELGERKPGDAARAALAEIALDAARMLGTDEAQRIRVCASETCSARFYDRSPAGRRRWCSMATCGNEAKARRHRARAKSDRATGGEQVARAGRRAAA